MPHNNFWSLDSEQTSSRGLPSCREGNLASWGSESDGSNHTAAISLHPCSSVSSSHGQNQNHAHPCDRKKQQKHDQPSLQQLQVKHSQIIPKQQQQYLSNTHGQDKKLIYATSDHQQDKSLSVGINGNGNYMRASNSSTKTFPNNQNFIVTAGQTMQNNRKGILYLGYQNMDSPSEKGSYTPEPDVGQQQKPHVQQQHQQLATTNLSQGLQSSTSLDEGLDGHSLYCTEVLPVSTPPSQPITVEGGGTSRRGFLSINGGASFSQSQPVQYAIILADPQQHLQQHGLVGGGRTSALVSSTNTTSILLNTLTQQQQQHLQQQQFRNQSSVNQVGLTPEAPAKIAPALSHSPGSTNLVISSSGEGSNKLSTAFLNATNHLNANNFTPALVAYSVSLTGGHSQALVSNNTADNGDSSKRSANNPLLVTGDNRVKATISNQHHQQTGLRPAAVPGHGVGVDPAQLQLVELPEAARTSGSAPSGIVLFTYAPAGPGDSKAAGSGTIADIASIAQIQGLNAPSSKGFRFGPQHQTSTSSPFFTTSVEPTYKTKDGLSKITCAVLPTTSVGAVRLSVPVTGNDSSSAISQESNLNNHIRVLSASKKGFSSSANSAAFTCSASELTKPGTVAPLITGDLGVWTSFVRSSPPLPSNPSAVPTELHHQQQTYGGHTPTPPSPGSSSLSSLQRQDIKHHHLEHRHSPDAASNGAPGGMHSGRAGQSGLGQHPHGIGTSSSTDSSSSGITTTTTNNSSINPHYRTSSPVDRNPNKPTSATSPASSASSSSSPPPPPPPSHHHLQTSLSMLSAGPPSIPAGIFRTGADSHSSSRLPGGSSSATYTASPYSSLYGGHHQQGGQSTTALTHANLPGLAPYPAFFPGPAAAAGSLHGYGPSGLMAPSVSSPAGGAAGAGGPHHYPRIESYSAVLASMGSQALQASAGSGLERSLRGPVSGVAALPNRGISSSYLPSAASRAGHGFLTGGISSGLPSPSSASSPPSSSVHRRLSGGSGSPSPGHGASNNSIVSGSRLSPLDKMAAMKAGGTVVGRDASNRLAFDLSEERVNRPSPPSGPKVSFDSVVKEFGGDGGEGGVDSPPTPGYLRASLSGKEGSLKHRILTRPSDSEPPSGEDSPGSDRERRLRDEPAQKRAKFSSSSSPLSPTPPLVSGGSQSYLGRDESTRGNIDSSRGGHPQHHITSHHPHPIHSGSSSSGTTDHGSTRGYHHSGGLPPQAGTSHPPHTQTHYQPHYTHQQQSAAHYQQQQPQRYQGHPLQDDISGNNNTTTINKNTRDNSSSSTGSSSIPQQTHSSYPSVPSSAPSSRRQPSSSSSSPPAHDLPDTRSPPPQSSSHLQYPQHFMKGSIIQLANGALKRVEDLQTEDFVSSAQVSSDLKVDSSTVVRIEEHLERGTAMLSFSVGEHRVQVTVEATLEHPFFVFGQGWSSCSVTRTLARYGLDCQKLNVGDVCISLTHKDVSLSAADICQQQQQQQQLGGQQGEGTPHNNNGDKKHWDQKPVGDSAVSSTPLSTSSAPCGHLSSSPPISSPTLQPKVSQAMSPLKIDTKDSLSHDLSVLPPPSSSPSNVLSNNKRQQQQQNELPPPLSNFVPVKKESGAPGVRDHYHHHHHHSRRRSGASSSISSGPATWQRSGADFSSPECKEEIDRGADQEDSVESMSRKRRWSAPDPGLVKAEKERERERQHLADQAQRLEEREDPGSTASGGDRGDESATGGSTSNLAESSPSAPSSPPSSSSTAK